MYTQNDLDLIEKYWVRKSREDFFAYRQYIHAGNFLSNWFVADLCNKYMSFYRDLKAGLRPILLIQVCPQHGKSLSVIDFLTWLAGKSNQERIIFASYSDTLGKRANRAIQRIMNSPKYAKIFPNTNLPKVGQGAKNTEHIEFVDGEGLSTGGQFRNTTVGGSITGETLSVGALDDAVKGREQANSLTWSDKIWSWYTDDFGTRFADDAGQIIVMTRWTTHDIIGRLLEAGKGNITLVNYPAIATQDEEFRKEGEALFPELKSLEFLQGRKAIMAPANWEALYQGSPVVEGGNLLKDSWFSWFKRVPRLKYRFIVADTAQKLKSTNDWTVFHHYGVGYRDNKLYLLDRLRERMDAPTLRAKAEAFYIKHDTKRMELTDSVLRDFYIEDKSSGTGLIQELKAVGVRVKPVPRSTDKVLRANDAAPYLEQGNVLLREGMPGIDNLLKETREMPESQWDDEIDTLISAIEITYINAGGSLYRAMTAEDDNKKPLHFLR